jgi:endonuclease/exonuclease/phosphatase family metal-dependent hydrolase
VRGSFGGDLVRRADQKRLVELALWALQYKQVRIGLLVLAAVALGVWLLAGRPGCQPPPPPPTYPDSDDPPISDTPAPAEAGDYLLCFWNVENLFDDRDDGRTQRGDKEFDQWYSRDPAVLHEKLQRLTDVLLAMNDGKGPDVLCVAEVESLRAGQLLQQAFNRRVPDPKLAYTSVLYDSPGGGRNIGTAILTRLPVDGKPTLLATRSRFRILEGRVKVEAKTLVVVASHWSSRISDKDGATRSRYADAIYGRFRQLHTANPKVDFLVCGDFNDNPDDPSVTDHLRAVGDADMVRAARRPPLLFNLSDALWQNGQASHFYGSKGYLFDQVCVSPGMLDDEGWSAVPDTARVVKKIALRNGRPNRFGGENDKRPLAARGASDHFPVTVTLRVR